MRRYIHILLVVGIASLICVPKNAGSAELKVLSDGPLEPALTQIVDPFRRASGHTVSIEFGLSPAIHKRVTDGEVADVVIIQPNFVDEFSLAGKLKPGGHPVVARAGIGLFVRANAAAAPDISTPSALQQALLGADAVVFSNVAAGNYFATVLERLGISEAIKAKVTRASPADVIIRIVQGKGNDIGVGTVPLILPDKRLKLIGPLPRELQSYLVYVAAIMKEARSPDAAMDFVRFLGSPSARAAFTAAGAD
jgi:molybdate transport system substrate-binding protein